MFLNFGACLDRAAHHSARFFPLEKPIIPLNFEPFFSKRRLRDSRGLTIDLSKT